MARFAAGDLVVVLPPFGDGTTPLEVAQVQHFNEAGELVPGPAEGVQYVLADGLAYVPEWLEAAP